MRTDVMAKDYLRRAKSRLIDAKSALDRGDYPEVVRPGRDIDHIQGSGRKKESKHVWDRGGWKAT